MTRLKPVQLALALAVVLVALQALLVPLFAGPAAHLEPRDLPIAVAGPQPAADRLAAQLTAARPGAFTVTVVDDADTAIRDRDVYAAVVLTADGPSLHIASAASPTVATLLTQTLTPVLAAQGGSAQGGAAQGGSAQGGSAQGGSAQAGVAQGGAVQAGVAQAGVAVVDVVPVAAGDPRGAAFVAGFLPLAITGMVAGVLAFLLVRRRGARVVALGTFAVLAGLVGALVQRSWLGVLPGDYLLDAAALGLFALAISSAVAGLGALLGPPGLGLGAVTFFLVGKALSGVCSAPELLPHPWGAVGQFLPIGAGASVLRSDAYFGGRGSGVAVAVLIAYAMGGLILVLAGRRGLGEPAPVA